MSEFTKEDEHWMQYALDLARAAASNQEVPVGAVLIHQEKIIGEGANSPISLHDPTAHAEILTLRSSGRRLQNYRLVESTLYVTLEPCVMCVGALVHARIKKVIFGAFDLKSGAVVSTIKLSENKSFNHKIQWSGGLMEKECGGLLSEFFLARRKQTK